MSFLKTTVCVADKLVTEGNLEFQACMKCTSSNQKRLEQAHTKIDMGLNCKPVLELELTNLEKRKKK